jgi:hypothetical protein
MLLSHYQSFHRNYKKDNLKHENVINRHNYTAHNF